MNNKTALIHRLNRAQGQIEALKRSVQADENLDCSKMLQQIKAVSQALKKFAEAYVSQHMEVCLEKNMSKRDIEKKLQEVITSAFNF